MLTCYLGQQQLEATNTDCFQSIRSGKLNLDFKRNQNPFSTSEGKVHGRTLLIIKALNQAGYRLSKTQECFPNQAVKIFNRLSSYIRAEAQSVRQKGASMAEVKFALYLFKGFYEVDRAGI